MQSNSLVSGRASAQQVISSDPALRLKRIPMSVPGKNWHCHLHFIHSSKMEGPGATGAFLDYYACTLRKPIDIHALREAQTIAH